MEPISARPISQSSPKDGGCESEELSQKVCADIRRALQEELQATIATQTETIVREIQPMYIEIKRLLESWMRPPRFPALEENGSETESQASSECSSNHPASRFSSNGSAETKKIEKLLCRRVPTWSAGELEKSPRSNSGVSLRVHTAPVLETLPSLLGPTIAEEKARKSGGDATLWASLPELFNTAPQWQAPVPAPAPAPTPPSPKPVSPKLVPTHRRKEGAKFHSAPAVVKDESPSESPERAPPHWAAVFAKGSDCDSNPQRVKALFGAKRNKREVTVDKTSTLRNLEDLLSKELFAASDLYSSRKSLERPRHSASSVKNMSQDLQDSPRQRTMSSSITTDIWPRSLSGASVLSLPGVDEVSPQKTNRFQQAWPMRSAQQDMCRSPPPHDNQHLGQHAAHGTTGNSHWNCKPVKTDLPPFTNLLSIPGSPQKPATEGSGMLTESTDTSSNKDDSGSCNPRLKSEPLTSLSGLSEGAALELERRMSSSSRSSSGSEGRRVIKCQTAPPAPTDSPLGRSPSRSPSKVVRHISLKVEGLRQLREKELTQDLTKLPSTPQLPHCSEVSLSPEVETSNLEAEDDCVSSPLEGNAFVIGMLKMCGVLPWSTERIFQVYPWIIITVAALSVVSCVQQIAKWPGSSSACVGHFSDMAFASGAFAALLCGQAFQREIHDCNALLVSYAAHHDFLDRWTRGSTWDALIAFALWLLVVLERWRFFIMCWRDSEHLEFSSAFETAGFAFASGVIMMLMHYILYVSRCLSAMIDTFCCHFAVYPDFKEAVAEWNVLQAVIRKTCGSIQYCFFVLQTTMVVAALLSVVDAMNYPRAEMLVLLPGSIVILTVLHVFFCVGGVTDKCARVPALVNSLSFGTVLDRDRLYVVEYISHSQAGFYIFEVRVTSAVVLKLFYFSCIVAFTVATRFLSLGNS